MEVLKKFADKHNLSVRLVEVVSELADNSFSGSHVEITVRAENSGEIKALYPLNINKTMEEILGEQNFPNLQFHYCQARIILDHHKKDTPDGGWQESSNEIAVMMSPAGRYFLKIGRHRETGPIFF